MQKIFNIMALVSFFGILGFFGSKLVNAAITNSSRVIPYQGRLTDSSGNNVADSTYAMTFKIYTVSSGGSASFTEAHSSVTVTSGLFSVLLGSLSANGVNLDFANPPYYLGITIGTNSEMSPRIQMGFAALATNAQYLDGNPASSLVPSGTIAFFATTCPTAWTEYTAARGRVVVGTPLSGTNAGTVGTALTNLENRTHVHATQDHTLTITEMPAHTHGVNVSDTFAGSGISRATTNNVATANTNSAGGGGGHNHGDTTATSATPPYIQLTACQKN